MNYDDLLKTVTPTVARAIEMVVERAGTSDADWDVLKASGELIVRVGGLEEPIDRILKHKWSKTRSLIASMNFGATIILPLTERNNATTSIQRLSDIYPDSKWITKTIYNELMVTRTK